MQGLSPSIAGVLNLATHVSVESEVVGDGETILSNILNLDHSTHLNH